eukprot:scaffold528492_cov52-Prasinocladus_malaysianus.AAC.1
MQRPAQVAGGRQGLHALNDRREHLPHPPSATILHDFTALPENPSLHSVTGTNGTTKMNERTKKGRKE